MKALDATNCFNQSWQMIHDDVRARRDTRSHVTRNYPQLSTLRLSLPSPVSTARASRSESFLSAPVARQGGQGKADEIPAGICSECTLGLLSELFENFPEQSSDINAGFFNLLYLVL